MSLTKVETRTIFDMEKICRGDVVKFKYAVAKGLFKLEMVPAVGIVQEVNDTYLLVYIASHKEDMPSNRVLDVERADEIEIFYRPLI